MSQPVAHHAAAHKDSHKSGGNDAFILADLLDCLARFDLKKAGTSIGKRRGLNLIEGSGVTLTIADDPTNEEVDVTIAWLSSLYYWISDDIFWANDTQRSTNSATVVKLKEMQLTNFIENMGTIRTYFELRQAAALTGRTVYGQVYRNGVAVGSLRSTTSTAWVAFTEDLSGWSANGYYQIYGYRLESDAICAVQYQRVLGYIRIKQENTSGY